MKCPAMVDEMHLQLSSLSLRLDVISDDRDISEVEGGVNFVHEVERGGLAEENDAVRD